MNIRRAVFMFLQDTILTRGETFNYTSGIVAKGFLWIVFCDIPFCSFFAASLVKCMVMNIRHYVCVASASPQPRVKKKYP